MTFLQRNVEMLFATVLQLCLVQHTEAAKILFLYFPTYSHYTGTLSVATELASRGHRVWNALPTALVNDKRLQVQGVKNLEYRSLDNFDVQKQLVDDIVEKFFEQGTREAGFEYIQKTCGLILRDDALLMKLRNLNLDLMVLDASPIARMLTIIAYRLDVPFVFIGAAFEPYASRTPFVLSTFPFIIMPWTPVMDFQTRLVNSVLVVAAWLYDPFSSYRSVEEYAPEKPYITLESLVPKALVWLVSLEPFLHTPQATLPNVKLIGSLSASDPMPLPEVYQKFMDEAKDGVVIVSFGSNVKHLPAKLAKKFIDAFQQTKYKFIFKTDKETKFGSKVMLTKWMPQSDLLAHPNTKLFITHCGANGQNEAFLSGVPMIGFPLFAEQPFNAAKIAYKGFGLKMDINDFTVDELVGNINLVIQNSSYTKKIRKAAEITKLRQRSPKDEALYWIEHVLQYGGDHLRSYCQDMALYQYLNLDVIGVFLFLFHLFVFLIWKMFKICVRKLCCSKSERKTKLE